MRVLRENLPVLDYQTIALPNHDRTRLLSVAPCRSGDERVDVWWLNPDLPADEGEPAFRDFAIYMVGTGHRMPPELNVDPPWLMSIPPQPHLFGTCVMPSHLVWHVFEGPVRP